MKKIFALLMVVITLLGCVACNTDNTLECSFCGTKNVSEAKFCSDCGKEIKGSAETSQPEMKKTSEEKLRDYLLENGTKTYDDLYYIKSYEYKNSKYDTYFIYYDKENDEIYIKNIIRYNSFLSSKIKMIGYNPTETYFIKDGVEIKDIIEE